MKLLLVLRCFECHAGTSKRLEGGLRLDARPFVLKGGGDLARRAVVGKPDESLLHRVRQLRSVRDAAEGPAARGRDRDLPQVDRTRNAVVGRRIECRSCRGRLPARIPQTRALGLAADLCWKGADVKDAAWPADDFDRFVLSKPKEKAETEPSMDRSCSDSTCVLSR